MSESKWGVTVLVFGPGETIGKRQRATVCGEVKVFEEHSKALAFASSYHDIVEPRLVKLTRRAKGWRPASEPPNDDRRVQVSADTLKPSQHVVRHIDGRWWTAFGDRIAGVTHWRELPAGPK